MSAFVKNGLTIFLSIIAILAYGGYVYIIFSRLYYRQKNKIRVLSLATGSLIISFTVCLFIWMLWNPLVRTIFWALFLLALLLSFFLGASVASPYITADLWEKLFKRLNKRNPK